MTQFAHAVSCGTQRGILRAILHAIVMGGLCLSATLACVNRSSNTDVVSELLPALTLTTNQSVLIIGDSLTDFSSGFGLQSRLGPGYTVAFRGIINTDFNFWIGRLDEAFAQATTGPPAYILVPLGTNDGFTLAPPQFLERVATFHAELRKRSFARVYYFTMPGTLIGTLAPAIAANNAALRPEHVARYAGDNSVLVDLETVFQNASPVPALYDAGDPLHPTQNGYDLMAIEMERAVRQQ
ncbi:MAG: SGNH/GDSL hydrolase family protein [bacterium]|nr:SGNH/GDSL hydrolase family protein [bacterium]